MEQTQQHQQHRVSFQIAGLNIQLSSAVKEGLSSLWHRYYPDQPHDGPPDLTIRFEYDPDFVPTTPPRFAFPKFTSKWSESTGIILWRKDNEGCFRIPANETGTVAGEFRGHCTVNALEAALRVGVSLALVQRGGFMLHASAVVKDGKALLFAGVSGAGKSTISRILGQLPDYDKVADDLLLVTPTGQGEWLMHTGPFLARDELPHGTQYPVIALHYLRQALTHIRTPLSLKESFRELPQYMILYPDAPIICNQALQAVEAFITAVPVFQLEFAKNRNVAKVLVTT